MSLNIIFKYSLNIAILNDTTDSLPHILKINESKDVRYNYELRNKECIITQVMMSKSFNIYEYSSAHTFDWL